MISDSRFQHALATASDDLMFQHVPVDWWDRGARVWRPSVVESCITRTAGGPCTHAQIVAPGPVYGGVTEVNYVAKQVAITELRPSRLIDEQIAQFFTTRYTLELVESLMPCLDLASQDERAQMERVIADLLDAYTDSYSTWLDAFSAGSRGDAAGSADVWREQAVDAMYLPGRAVNRRGRVTIFNAVAASARGGAIDCSPVAFWDEGAGLWRPTMILGATGEATQYSASARVRILEPGNPVDVVTVAGSLLQPLELSDTCFSLIAIPVLARDFMRTHAALDSAGFTADDAAAHPTLIALARMLDGAADEWRGIYDEGLNGAPPEPRVEPIHPSLWGLSSEDADALCDESGRG